MPNSKGSSPLGRLELADFKALGVLVVLGAVLLGAAQFVDLDGAKRLISDSGPLGPMLYVVIKAATYIIAPLGGGLLQVAAGAIFGLPVGVVLTLLGDSIGAVANFLIARYLGRRVFRALVGQRGMQRIEGAITWLEGPGQLLRARLFLTSIYDFISYAAGLTKIPLSRFVATTVIAGLPPTVLFVGLGAVLAENLVLQLAVFGALIVAFLIPVVINQRSGKAKNILSEPNGVRDDRRPSDLYPQYNDGVGSETAENRFSYVYLTTCFAGSGLLLRRLIDQLDGQKPLAVVLSVRKRRRFIAYICKRSGLRYVTYLAMVGFFHRFVESVFRVLKGAAFDVVGPSIRNTVRALSVPVLIVEDVEDVEAEALRALSELTPDMVVSVFFDQRLPLNWLELAKVSAVNLHNSALPEFAGCAPTVAALVSGRTQVGVSLHVMSSEFDAGPIIAQEYVSVHPGGSVFDIDRELMELGIDLLASRFRLPVEVAWNGTAQAQEMRTYQSHPQRRQIRQLRARGFRLVKLENYIQLFRGER